jgi:transposase
MSDQPDNNQRTLDRYDGAVPKPQYPQEWAAYNKAKTNEDLRFKELVIELAKGIPDNPTPKRGRKGFSQKERFILMAMREHYKGSLRKCESILKVLATENFIPNVPTYASISNFYGDEELTPLLEQLVKITALPALQVESVGAIDATGWSLRRYRSWREQKYGKLHVMRETLWVKLHIICGTLTHTIALAEVTPSNTADITMMQSMLSNCQKYFDMKEFVADKGYLSRDTIAFLSTLGIDAYIPFKSNSIRNSKGVPMWRQMFDYFQNDKERYMEHYHRRSNVETTFHMLKSRYGDYLTTKSFPANKNEVLMRVICHNVCVLIQESIELGIKVDFTACQEMGSVVKN